MRVFTILVYASCIESIVFFWGILFRIIRKDFIDSTLHSTVSPFLKFIVSDNAFGKFTYH